MSMEWLARWLLSLACQRRHAWRLVHLGRWTDVIFLQTHARKTDTSEQTGRWPQRDTTAHVGH